MIFVTTLSVPAYEKETFRLSYHVDIDQEAIELISSPFIIFVYANADHHQHGSKTEFTFRLSNNNLSDSLTEYAS